MVTSDSLPLSSVLGLVTHVIQQNIALSLVNATATALASRIAQLEAHTIVTTHTVVMMHTLEWANANANLVYHRYKTDSINSAITYNKMVLFLLYGNRVIIA